MGLLPEGVGLMLLVLFWRSRSSILTAPASTFNPKSSCMTWKQWLAKWNVIPSLISAYNSSTSFLLSSGKIKEVIPYLLAPMVFSLTPPIALTLPARVISPVMAISCWAGRLRASERRAEVMATPADGPSLPISISGKFRWTSFCSRQWLLKKVEVMYLAQVQASWQDSFITSWILPVTSRDPLFPSFPSFPYSTGEVATGVVVPSGSGLPWLAHSMYMMDPPQLLQARPIITPAGGAAGKSLASWKGGNPMKSFRCWGRMVLSKAVPLTYLQASFWKIWLVLRTRFLTPASLQYPSINARAVLSGNNNSFRIYQVNPFSVMVWVRMYLLKICNFSIVVYPATSILSNLSSRGGKMVSSELAVQMKSTLDRSTSTSMKSSLNLWFWTGSKTYITASCRLAPLPLVTILSISSRRMTGFSALDLKTQSQILPGQAPTQVLRWPLMMDVSYYPPSETLAQGLPRHLAMLLTIEVLPTPGGPQRSSTLDLNSPLSLLTAMNSNMRCLSLSMPKCSSQRMRLALAISNSSLASCPKGQSVSRLMQCFFLLTS